MTHIIAEPCIGTKDTACVDVCPVDCIHPTKDEAEFEQFEMLYIDRLARHGVRFENAYSTSPWTSPSVISMVSGNYATSYHYSVTGTHRVHTPRPKIEYADLPRIYVPDDEHLGVTGIDQIGKCGTHAGIQSLH